MTTLAWSVGTYAELVAADAFNGAQAAYFDIFYTYSITPSTATATITQYLDACHAVGLKAMLTVRELGKNVVMNREAKTLSVAELAALTAFVDAHKTHPALWGWYADDEGTAAQYPIATRQQVYDTIKAADPSGIVVEANYQCESGAYSAAVHDLFAFDWYPYKFDTYPDAPDYGCLSVSTGLVTSSANETAALDYYATQLASIKATLDANADTYVAIMQAFNQTTDGALVKWGMPPVGGFDKEWAKVQAAGFDDYGAAWFEWWGRPYSGGSPAFVQEGIGNDGYTTERAEVAAINATVSDSPVAAIPDTDHIDLTWAFGTGPYLIERRAV